ncbi:MAG: polysaccharide biosynthesis protein [Phycisphaerales bacterium]|nr:polysaccharide biosynthesis protein [Phycisphaerales bacterium]
MPNPDRPIATHDAEFKPLGGSTTVLIGTVETLTSLAQQCRAAAVSPEPVGCLVVGERLASGVGAIATDSTPGHGLAVLGTLEDLGRVRDRLRVRAAVVSLPATMPAVIADVSRRLAEQGVEERFIPPLREVMAPSGPTSGWWRPVRGAIDPAQLIGREPHRLDRAAVGRVLRGKRVLITGAGGSIGSELARIAAGFEPELLILMERSENALFEVDRQLGATGAVRRAVLHDVVDAPATRRLLGELRPDVVFHAAAHKHVPLMEDHPAHAVTNNVFGTKSVADAAAACGCGRFVLISTDKAVHPTSVMGATKRVAELYVRWLHGREREGGRRGGTTFSVVRFGNVLGSACSVLPIWAAQLADGGPITVTDPRMTRFFMTIPEAATLVAQAAALSTEGPSGLRADAPLFVLDMGAPIRILDLAERFVRLHGFECGAPGEEAGRAERVEILFTGIRPGEKLDEELTYRAERLRPTRHPGIRALESAADPLPEMSELIGCLDEARRLHEAREVLAALRACLPEMEPAGLRRVG